MLDSGLLRGNLDLILLSVLEQSPGYGLDIAKRVEVQSNGQIKLNVGSLYPALHRLERAGFLLTEASTPPNGGPVVKTYTLTEAGRAELGRRRDNYLSFDQVMRSML